MPLRRSHEVVWTNQDRWFRDPTARKSSTVFTDAVVIKILTRWSVLGASTEVLMERLAFDRGLSSESLPIGEALSAALRRAESNFIVASSTIEPPPAEFEKRLKAIVTVGSRLLELLGLDPDQKPEGRGQRANQPPSSLRSRLFFAGNRHANSIGGLSDFSPRSIPMPGDPQFKDWRVREALPAAINGVRRLRHWAALAANAEQGRKGKTTKRGDPALNGLIGDLLTIWVQILGQRITGTRIGGNSKRSGSLTKQAAATVQFLMDCLTAMHLSCSENALVSRIAKARGIHPLKSGEYYPLLRWR